MNERVEAQAKASSTPPPATTFGNTLQQQRPLAESDNERLEQVRSFGSTPNSSPVPPPSDPPPNVQTQQDRASRFGHNFANISVNRGKPAYPPIQALSEPKLALTQPQEQSEQQADQVPAWVRSMPASMMVERRLLSRAENPEKPVQMSLQAPLIVPRIQREPQLDSYVQSQPPISFSRRHSESLDFDYNLMKPLQPKLTIGQVGDKYEVEADRVAQQVMSIKEPTKPQLLQQLGEEKESLHKQSLADSITPVVSPQSQASVQSQPSVQRAVAPGGVEATESLEQTLKSQQGGGSPLSKPVRDFMEPRIGADFSLVKVHTDSTAVQMNQQLNAQAFTHGRDIYFNTGKYNPSSDSGKRLLAHELTHVVQQTGLGEVQAKANIQCSVDGDSRIPENSQPKSRKEDLEKQYDTLINKENRNKQEERDLQEILKELLPILAQEAGVTLEPNQLNSLVGKKSRVKNLTDDQCYKFVTKAGSDWEEVKHKYLKYTNLMWQLVNYRGREVKGIFNQLKKDFSGDDLSFLRELGHGDEFVNLMQPLLKKNPKTKHYVRKVQFFPLGSNGLTSDYDVTFFGSGAQNKHLEILMVRAFNSRFREKWGKESGTVFDTNVYTIGHMPAAAFGDTAQQYQEMKQLNKNLQEKLQEIDDLQAELQNPPQESELYSQTNKKIINLKNEIDKLVKIINNAGHEISLDAKKLIETREGISTVEDKINELKEKLSEEIEQEKAENTIPGSEKDIEKSQTIMSLLKIRRFIPDKPDGEDGDEWKMYKKFMLEGENSTEPKLLERVENLYKELKGALAEEQSKSGGREIDASNRLYENNLIASLTEWKRLNDLKKEREALKKKYKNKLTEELAEAIEQCEENMIDAAKNMNELQSKALYFANEAYHTGGPAEHVVITEQMRLDLDLSAGNYSRSINEQTGFAMEQLKPETKKRPRGKSLWKTGKYLARIADAALKLKIINTLDDKNQDSNELKEIKKMSRIGFELLKYKKDNDLNEEAKTQKAEKLAEQEGLGSITDFRMRVLKLNSILNRKILDLENTDNS